jgi:hypothetical protein
VPAHKATLGRIALDIGEWEESNAPDASAPDLAAYADDIPAFARDVLGVELWSAQIEQVESVRDHPQTLVVGANSTGKDFATSCLALWWAYVKRGPVVIQTPTQRQGRDIIMGTTRRLWHQAKLTGEMFTMGLRVAGELLIAVMTSSESSRLQGYHAGDMLNVLSEGQGIPPHGWEAAFACATGENNRILATGNPLEGVGEFYDAARSAAWHVIRVSAADHPNVVEGREVIPGGPSARWIESMAAQYGRDSEMYASRVLGVFPSGGSESSLFRPEWIETSMLLHEMQAKQSWQANSWRDSYGQTLAAAVRESSPQAGFDPARLGADMSALCVRRGPAVVHVGTWSGTDLMQTTGKLLENLRPFAHDAGPAAIVVDAPGLGAGVYDRLNEQWMEGTIRSTVKSVVDFYGSRKSTRPSRWANARAEAYWKLRERLRLLHDSTEVPDWGQVAFLPNDPRLREELLAVRFITKSDGSIQIEGKDEIRSRLGRSPDTLDAVVLAFAREPRVVARSINL